MTQAQVQRKQKRTEQEVTSKVDWAKTEHGITVSHLRDELAAAPTEADKVMDRIDTLKHFIEETFPLLASQVESLPREPKKDWDELNTIFQRILSTM
ncbi:MAG: hypothetical protein LBG99_06680 [Propionibacteriaceae bacterium]|jgi:uncharacterized protein YdgA (DUF945 family)|nr:hypothetical protein [Propionibacteriaceae bacterium]